MMRLILLAALATAPALAMQTLEGLKFAVPQGWELNQDARSEGTLFVGLAKGKTYLRFYAKDRSQFSPTSMLTSAVQVNEDKPQVLVGALKWRILEGHHRAKDQGQNGLAFFHTEWAGHDYYGYVRAEDTATARREAMTFLRGIVVRPIDTLPSRSLTGAGFYGKKYYLGFGDTLSGFMGNEVKYDIAHTHDIFTEDVGGEYVGAKLQGHSIGGSAIRRKWAELGRNMTDKDMYVQYSSGHGSHTGLMIGVSYDEIRDNALGYPAKEVIVFTMACYSGNLVSSFNRKRHEWQDWGKAGRTLMVMASSLPHETSATGPLTDSDEAGGPKGSAGSAFGHALWKALIGYADGFRDGVRDGFVSLGEIRDYATWKTKRVGGHTPVVTGVYQPGLVMNRVPSKAFLASRVNSSESLTEAELAERIRELDAAFRVEGSR